MRGRILGLALLVILSPSTAAADWLLSPFVGLRFGADTSIVIGGESGIEEKKPLWGVSVVLLTDGLLGLEADFSYVPGFFITGDEELASSRVITFTGNVVVAAPLSATGLGLRPYLTGGLGLLHARALFPPPADVLRIDSNFLGLNFGGGAIGPISPRSSIRFELRHTRSMTTDEEALTLMPGTQLSFWRATVGLTIHFRP